jgi:hypothetical protein
MQLLCAPIEIDLKVFYSDGWAHFLLGIRWLTLVLLFNLGMMGMIVRTP